MSHIVPVWATAATWRPDRTYRSHWPGRRWMNTPGPFYTHEPDFALLGPTCAPDLVGFDHDDCDVYFRQPLDASQLASAIKAADCDPFGGHAADGNAHWTIPEVRAWWSRRNELAEYIRGRIQNPNWPFERELPLILRFLGAWLHHLDNEMHAWLRTYCFFLDNRRWPSPPESLPDV